MRNLVDTPKLQTEDDQFPGDGELSTSHLDSGLLAAGSNLAYSKEPSPQEPERPNTDWLRVLASQPEYTETFDDALPEPPPQPSGMALHTAPPRIRMTIGSRLALLLRRGTLLIILAALAVGLLAAGVYGLTSTTWFSPWLGPTPAAPAPANPPGGSAAPQQPPAPAQPPASLGDSSTTSGAQGDATTLVEQGVAAYKAGNYERAIGFMESAVDINGSDAVTYYQLGLAYLAATGRAHALEDAEMAFKTAASLQPGWAAPHRLIAESLIRQGYFTAAVEPARQATQLDAGQADGWLTLGRAYKGAGRDAEASQAFAEAARHSPALPNP